MVLTKNVTREMRERVQSTLDQLITLNRDAIEGYKKAASLLEDEHYKRLCLENAAQREIFVENLTHTASTYEGDPKDVQSAAGRIHEAWISIVSMVTGGDGAILAQCDREEEGAVAMYQDAIQKDLPDDVMELLRAQFSQVKATRQHINRLSNALMQ